MVWMNDSQKNDSQMTLAACTQDQLWLDQKNPPAIMNMKGKLSFLLWIKMEGSEPTQRET